MSIFYFSGSGKSKRIAEYLGKVLGFPFSDLTKINISEEPSVETAVIVFPVYCQNLPDPVKDFIPKLKAKSVSFIASYGRKSYGNVIEDAANLSESEFIGGACVPCGHSFLDEPDGFDFDSLSPITERIKNPEKAKTEKGHKDFYADLIPAQRTRIGVILRRNDSCNHCGICEKNCPMNAIKNGKTDKNCIRCLRCVSDCPQNAVTFKTLWFMKAYLLPMRKNELKFYL